MTNVVVRLVVLLAQILEHVLDSVERRSPTDALHTPLMHALEDRGVVQTEFIDKDCIIWHRLEVAGEQMFTIYRLVPRAGSHT